MTGTGVVISAGASRDITALATGQDRVVVALAALKEAKDNGTLTTDQALALDALAGKAEKLHRENQTAMPALRDEGASTGPSATASPDAAQFETAYAGQLSTLEVRPGVHGKREVRFTLKGGLDNLGAACDEINEAMNGARNYPKVGFKVYLSGNNDLPRGQDVVVTWTPVIRDSGNRVRFGAEPETSHQGLLKSLELEEVNNDIQRLASGALRCKEGFPQDRDKIGTTEDQGDLNEGMVVRTAKGARSGAVASDHGGVGVIDWGDDVADGNFVVAGASPRN